MAGPVSLRESNNVVDLQSERRKREKPARRKTRPKERITADNWATLQPEVAGKKDVIYCSHKDGFALVINPGGSRSYAMDFTCENGEQRLRTLGRCKTTPISAAHKKMDRLVKQAIITGEDISRRVERRTERAALRLRAAHTEYCEVMGNPQLEDPISPDTIKRYGFSLENLVQALGGEDVLFFEITRANCIDIHRFLSDPKKRKINQRSRTGSLAKANFALNYLDILWGFHSKQFEKARVSPVIAVRDRMQKTKKRDTWIQPHALHLWWNLLERLTLEKGLQEAVPVWTLYFRMMILTGRRRTELHKLRWENVDLKRGTYTIIKGNAKNRIEVQFPLGRWLKAQLIALRKTQDESTEWVWAYPQDTRYGGLRLDRPEKMVKLFRTLDSQFAKWQMHDCRRTFSSIALCRAVETPTFTHKRMMNHKVKDQTADYSQITADMMRPYVQLVENVMLALKDCTDKDAAMDIVLTKMEDK